MENFRGDFSGCVLFLWKCFSKFVFILISILLIDVAIVIVVVAYLLHVQRAVAELWKIACLANNNNSRRGNKVRGEAGNSAVKPKLSCPQTPFGGPLLTQSLWARSVLTVDACAAPATTTAMKQPRQQQHNQWGKCKQFMRPSAQVLGFLPHLTGIPKEREKKKERERWQRTCHYVIRIRLTDSWVN